MNPDYLDKWPESYPVTIDAVREHLHKRPRIGDPAVWRRCAEFFDNAIGVYGAGICWWMDNSNFHGTHLGSEYYDLSRFFDVYMRSGSDYLWPCRAEFAPRRAALCRTVAAWLEELQLNPPAA